jgi:hypothetical protein
MSLNSPYPGRFTLPLALLLVTGCGDKSSSVDLLPRLAVSGSVSLDGKPMPEGRIVFEPTADIKGPTAIAVADIKDGKYVIDRAQGPVPGKHKVAITSRPSHTIGVDDMPGTAPKREAEKIPSRYNTKTTLTKDISADSPNQFDFEVTSK